MSKGALVNVRNEAVNAYGRQWLQEHPEATTEEYTAEIASFMRRQDEVTAAMIDTMTFFVQDPRESLTQTMDRYSKHLRNFAKTQAGHGCEQCGEKPKKLYRCAGCRFIFYCGQKCQRAAWPSHQEQCRDLTQKWEKIK